MNPQDLLKQLMGNPGASAAAGGFLGGSLSGLLTSKKGRKSAKKMATYGGLAALGVMAYQAFQRSRGGGGFAAGAPGAAPHGAAAQAVPAPPTPAGAAGAPPPPPTLTEGDARAATEAKFLPAPDDDAGVQNLTSHLLAAMISAARADNVLDADEQRRIHGQLAEADLPAAEKGRLLDMMGQPADPNAIAALAGSAEEGAELYLASALAIEPDHWAEQAYLQALRNALGLDENLARELEAMAAQQRQASG